MKRVKSSIATSEAATEKPARERILGAAFHAFTQKGYAATSTLEIATRAKVSKRELYTLFGGKQDILVACITSRATRMRLPSDLPQPRNHPMLASALSTFGTILLREVCHPAVMAMFRLAVAEAGRSPDVAQALEASGRDAARAALSELLAGAQSAGLIGAGDPVDMARQYLALLWQDLMVRLLLRVAEPPGEGEMQRRAANATAAFLQLHSQAELRHAKQHR